MSGRKFAAIVVILVLASIAWFSLAAATSLRTGDAKSDLTREVAALWGSPQRQVQPHFEAELGWKEQVWDKTAKARVDVERVEKQSLLPLSSRIAVDLSMDYRRKGLLWYRTYEVSFKAAYLCRHALRAPARLRVVFRFPARDAVYDDFRFTVGGKEIQPEPSETGDLVGTVEAEPGQEVPVEVAYRSRGMDTWLYVLGENISSVRDFQMVVNTGFAKVDFPSGSLSPTQKAPAGKGWKLEWKFSNLISGFPMGVEVPGKLNPGPWISRVSAFAPVGLLMLLAVLLIVGLVTGHNMHPMHYAFACASYFSFHLLMAYLVDHMQVEPAFLISAAVSVLLAISYLGRVVGWRYALGVCATAQLFFLVLFSYAFFFVGYTGLTITIGCIVTLAVLMHVTAGVKWDEVLSAPVEHRPSSPSGD